VLKFNHVLLSLLILSPSISFAQNGVLGRESAGSSQISLVVPERVNVAEINLIDGSLQGCGEFSKGLGFVAVSADGKETKPIRYSISDNCKGEIFATPQVFGETMIIVPSSI
jgi:hypothetical protein